MSDIHYFNAAGKEVSEGDESSVVQYTEADAVARGLKFKAGDAPDPKAVAETNAKAKADARAAATLDGSESPKSKQ